MERRCGSRCGARSCAPSCRRSATGCTERGDGEPEPGASRGSRPANEVGGASVNRREFIQITGAGVAGAAVLGGLTTKWYGLYADPLPDPRHRRRAGGADLLRALLLEVRRPRPRARRARHQDSRATRSTRSRAAASARAAPGARASSTTRTGSSSRSCGARKRGEQDFEPVTWDAALDAVAENFERVKQEHGACGARPLLSRLRRQLDEAPVPRLRLAQHRRALLRPVPRAARRRLPAHLRRGRRLARAHRHRQQPLPRAHRLAPGREHAQHPGAGVRRAIARGRRPHRRRPALLGGGVQGPLLAAHQAGHGPGAAARLDARDHRRGALRPRLRRAVRLRLRAAAAPTCAVQPRVGLPAHEPRAGPDPRDGARHRGRAAGHPDPPGPARHLVRRRHPAHRAPSPS